MSGIDLTEAVEAAARAAHDQCGCLDEGAPLPAWAVEDTQAIITAALPHIERQVREQVAREIEAEAGHYLPGYPGRSLLTRAASIARGES